MAKLVVEVLDACDLMPKDGQGSSSPFVEIEFDEQRQRTQTKPRDLNPQWNEKLVFTIDDPRDLPNKTIEVVVYNDRKGGGQHKNFLGRVRLSGASVPPPELAAGQQPQRYPLDKRGLFSNIKGAIALKVYTIYSQFGPPETQNSGQPQPKLHRQTQAPPPQPPPVQDINNNNYNNNFGFGDGFGDGFGEDYKGEMKKKKKKESEVRTFFSVGTGGGGGAPAPVPVPPPQKPADFEARADFAKAGPAATVMHMQQFPGMRPPPPPEFGLVETRPPLAARMGYRGGDKTSTTYDLVEQMHFLYVNVVKARDLPAMDITGKLDPYVEVKLGNYKGVTKHLEKNQNPVWNQVFAFSKMNLQSNVIEIVVKDKDFAKDDFVGRVAFDVTDVPRRVPPDSPLAPQWYKLENKKGEKFYGEIMLGVWLGTQADEAFPDAWHSDAHGISQQSLSNTRSKVYFSPKLYYLRLHVLAAQDLIPIEKGRPIETFVRVKLGHQARTTGISPIRHVNPEWKDELIFVVSEPFDEFMIIDVVERVGPGKEHVLGRLLIPVRGIPQRAELSKLPDAHWFNLSRPAIADEEDGKKKEAKFSSKIHLRLWLDVGYHVLDESTHFSSDLQPSSKHLRKPSIGILGVGILSARNLPPMKMGGDGGTTDAYCVAKYGNKWIRTRTLLNTLAPCWNEQYTWEVYDPCTVITIGVFDNWHINGSKDDARDQRIGKVRVRLSTLETDKLYTHYYPLFVLQPSGLKKHGELHLSIRFTCTAWVNMVAQYGKPLLPKMHYVHPIDVRHIDWLRHQAMQIVAARLSRAEPPLRREVVEYMLDVDIHMWSLRRSKANFNRIRATLSGVSAVYWWFNDVCTWKNPVTTCLVHVLFLILVCYPELILPTIFLYLFVIGLWNYRFRPRHPPHMDAQLLLAEMARVHPDEVDEEFDTFPTTKPSDIVRMRYDRMRHGAGRIQSVIGDLATHGERAISILGWRDPRATAIFIIIAIVLAVVLYVTPFQVIAVLIGLYMLRHPRFRSKLPSVPVNFFKRLPAKSDMLLL